MGNNTRHEYLASGYACPACGAAGTAVKDSRTRGDGVVRRRRECTACGHRFSTMEVPLEVTPMRLKLIAQRAEESLKEAMGHFATLMGVLAYHEEHQPPERPKRGQRPPDGPAQVEARKSLRGR